MTQWHMWVEFVLGSYPWLGCCQSCSEQLCSSFNQTKLCPWERSSCSTRPLGMPVRLRFYCLVTYMADVMSSENNLLHLFFLQVNWFSSHHKHQYFSSPNFNSFQYKGQRSTSAKISALHHLPLTLYTLMSVCIFSILFLYIS